MSETKDLLVQERQILDALSSRAQITEVVIAYCRAIDRMDEALLRSCFHPDATHEHGAFKGLSADFCTHAIETVKGLALSHHQLGPVSIALDGERAFPVTPWDSLEAGLTVMAVDRATETGQIVDCAPMWAAYDEARGALAPA